MKAVNRTRSKILGLGAILTFMLGCTLMQPVMAQTEGVKIKRVASSYAHISHVTISPTDAGLRIRGTVHKRWHTRGRIRGHVNIEVIASDGTLLFELHDVHAEEGPRR